MDLPSPGAIFGFVLEQLCSFRNQSLEPRHADGEIRAPYKTRARLLNRLGDFVQVLQPPSCTRHRIDAGFGEPLQVTGRDVRMGKLDRNIDSVKILRVDPQAVCVVVFVEAKNYFEPLPGSKALNHLAHFSVTDER